MEIDTVDANGNVTSAARCVRLPLIKRSGWTIEMFKVGARVEIEGIRIVRIPMPATSRPSRSAMGPR